MGSNIHKNMESGREESSIAEDWQIGIIVRIYRNEISDIVTHCVIMCNVCNIITSCLKRL